MKALFIFMIILLRFSLLFSQINLNGSDWLNKSVVDLINKIVKVKVYEEIVNK